MGSHHHGVKVNSFILKVIQVFFLRGFGAFSSILVTLLISNFYSISEAGILLFCITMVTAISRLTTLGGGIVLLRIASSTFKKDWFLVNTLVVSFVFFSFFVSATYILLALIDYNTISLANLNYNNLALTVFVILASLFYGLNQVFSRLFNAIGHPLFSTFQGSIFIPFVFCIILISLYFYFPKVEYYKVFIFYLVSIFLVLILTILIWYRFPFNSLAFPRKFDEDFWSSFKPIALFTILSVCYQFCGDLFSAIYLESSELAQYNVSKRISNVIMLLLIGVNVIVAPKFARAFKEGKIDKINHISLIMSRALALIALPLLIFICVFSEFVLSFFGKDYISFDSKITLIVMCMAQGFNVVCGSLSFLLNMSKMESKVTSSLMIVAPITLIMSALLTYNFGLIGAGASTCFGIVAQNILLVNAVKKEFGFNALNLLRR